jgi:uncharacterized membrane protein YphA (DoxX/SURF4 family)
MITFLLTGWRFARSLWRGFKDPEFKGLFLFVASILFSGTFFYHTTEHWGWVDSFYFSVTTLTTVGYGDLHPTTIASKLFTVVYLFVGIGVILGFVNAVAAHHSSEYETQLRSDHHKKRKRNS